MYSTYQQYQERGGKQPENVYLANAQKASELIDYYTMGRAASEETMKPQLSACECDLVDVMSTMRAFYSGVRSENNDGYSVSFGSAADFKIGIQTILKTHLTFPVNLISLSGRAFV